MQNQSPHKIHFEKASTFLQLADRIRNGESHVAESILSSNNVCDTDVEFAIDLIYREFLTLREMGETPDIVEFCKRFPNYTTRLRRLLEIDLELNEIADDQSSRTLPTEVSDADTIREVLSNSSTRIGRYRLLHQIGRGATSRVFKAKQDGLDRLVAIKLLNVHSAGQQMRHRFQREAELISRLQHPNIVQLFDFGCSDGQFYLVMEYVDAGGLDSQTDKAMSTNDISQLMIKLARAVQFAHDQNIIHRDLKPSNVLIRRDGEPKIADFGLAKHLETSDLTTATTSGTTLGTPSFMAPENVASEFNNAGPAADIYGLGAILYQLLTARPPFIAETVLETLRLVTDTQPVAPTRLRAIWK